MELRTFSINAMLADMEPLLRRLAGDSLDLAYIQAAGLWPVQLPPGKLEETFLALVVDACELPGPGVLRIETRNVSCPDGLPAGDYVMLSVTDTNRSVSDAVRRAIRGRGRREGLGLRLAYEIAEQFGGLVDLTADSTGGTTVRIVLPRADAAVPLRELAEAAELPTGTETILLVEDEKSLMSVAGRLLSRLGYSVLTASSAEAALRQLDEYQGPLHLLLTDLVLPGKDGLTLAAAVRKRRPDVRVLLMSGYSPESLGLGPPGERPPLLEKPFTLEGLAGAVRAALA
ncbi:MAG TPA: response regulator [Gemmatimonadales bacterium]|nr:response regulator [Gemmatimonadales bacterium]